MKDGKHIDEEGTIEYFKNGKYHRENGPAIIWPNGDKEWYLNGRCHREDGPADIFSDGTKNYWYYDHHTENKEEFYDERWRKEILMDLV